MPWRRLGPVFSPAGDQPWARSHAALPTPIHLGGDLFRIFYSARDAQARSHVGWVDIEVSETPLVRGVSPQPVLAPGEDGAFDDSGIGIGCVVAVDDALSLYYMGWNLGARSAWRNAIGLAQSKAPGAPFVRFSPGPIIDRSPEDPYTLSYPCVLRLGPQDWRMWYGSNLVASVSGTDLRHAIKYATSADGINWRRTAAPVVGFATADEYALARPTVVIAEGKFLMCFACRGPNYRIGAAVSEDGVTWRRLDADLGLGPSDQAWESEMTCYPALFWHRERLWLAYNGNGYGQTGFGLAVWDGELPL
jgi:hypothetical protein